MGVRLSPQEAHRRGLISSEEKGEIEGRRRQAPNQDPNKSPQMILWLALEKRLSAQIQSGDIVWEKSGIVEGRKYKADIAWLSAGIIIEVDGWQYHAKIKNNFKRDRQKDRKVIINGWTPIRFFYSEIKDDVESVVDEIVAIKSYLTEKE